MIKDLDQWDLDQWDLDQWELIEEMVCLDVAIGERYLGNDSSYLENDSLYPEVDALFQSDITMIVDMLLQSDIAYSLFLAENIDERKSEIEDILRGSSKYAEIKEIVSVDDAYKEATIRKDFAAALKAVKKGYMSIGHMVEFKMISKRTQLETTREKLGVLYKSVLYGPEATGKSCFLDSIRFLRDFVLTGKWIRIERFAGDAKGMERKTTFQITFLAEGKIYEYGVTLDTRKILEEWLLIHNDDTSFEPLFKRQITEIEGVFGKVSVKPRQLFLYVLAENGEQQIEPVVNWFQSIVMVNADDHYQMERLKGNRGEIYLVDNVDQLSIKKGAELFRYFSNKGKEQVICTAQESLADVKAFLPNEIWFIAKRNDETILNNSVRY